MARGGYRANAGRKGKKEAVLPLIAKAEEFAVFYKGLLERGRQGKKLTDKEKQQMNKLAAELTNIYDTGEGLSEKPIEDKLPLEFMLKVMNDTSYDTDTRARMAVAAAPFCHARKGEGAGKKDEKNERAKKASAGKFAPSNAPNLKLVQ